jgi:tRNA threonylcarbamoyladenosine biosynthesis protein TsaB
VILLAVETSSSAMSVALFRDATLVGALEREGRGDVIVALIDELLTAHGVTTRDVTRWAVDIGPGSFTGVRSGVATVKGIAFATGAEIVGVTAFDAMKGQRNAIENRVAQRSDSRRSLSGASGVEPPIAIALLDAGKGEVYFCIGTGEPGHAPLADVLEMIKGRPEPVIGPGVPPHAKGVGTVALGRAPDALDRLEPLYVRAPDLTRPISR